MEIINLNTIALLIVTLFIAPGLRLDAQEAATKNGFIFELESFSRQPEKPFLFLGIRMDPDHPRWGEFSESIDKFPSAQNCLNPPHDSGSNWNVLDINWKSLKSNRDIEVCLFRIFDTLNDPLLVFSWLEHQGYRLSNSWTSEGGLLGVPPQLVPSLYREAYIDRDAFERKVDLNHFDSPLKVRAKDYRIQISFSKTNRLVFVFSGQQGS